jgi:mycofactocin precursor
MQFTDARELSMEPTTQIETPQDAVEIDTLVEEVSIDGMCGVY